MKPLRYRVLLTVLVSVIVLASSAHAVTTKLGFNCQSFSATLSRLIDTGKVPIVLMGIGNKDSLVPYYKQRTPNGIVVLSLVGGGGIDYSQSPEDYALNRWNGYLWPSLSTVTPEQKAMIDYVQVSPNMSEPHSVSQAQWWNGYSAALCPLVANAGFKPLIYTIGVGGIPCIGSDELAVLQAMIPSLETAHSYGGGWAYHGYTLYYTMDTYGTETYYSLRYRRAYNFFQTNAPGLMDMPIALTEGGVDWSGDPVTSGYAYRGSRLDYAAWLYWYDQELKKDPYVLGVTLFKIGGKVKDWPSFDLDAMVPWFLSYYETGNPAWPRPPTVLGACVLGEETMSNPVRKICSSADVPIIYTDPSEVKPGGAIGLFKKANPNGIIVVGMRSRLRYSEEPDAYEAAKKRWNVIWGILGAMTPEQRSMITYVDASPGPVTLDTSAKISYFSTYMDVLRLRLSDNGLHAIIATFDPTNLPVDSAGWTNFSSFVNTWKNGGKSGAAMIYQTAVQSYTKDTGIQGSAPLKYRECYAYLLKYTPWLLVTPVIVIVGGSGDLRTIPDAVGRRPKGGLNQFQDWLSWYDMEANKDPDVLGVAFFKVGAPYAYPSSDLGNLVDWLTSYVEQRANPGSP